MNERQTKHPQAAIIGPRSQQTLGDLFRSWRQSDAEEQRETFDFLIRALDRDRLSSRELRRAEKLLGLQRLDQLKNTVDYLPITLECMLLAAQLWAECRKRGKPTADDASLDADVILAAQAAFLRDEGNDVVIATTNVGTFDVRRGKKVDRARLEAFRVRGSAGC